MTIILNNYFVMILYFVIYREELTFWQAIGASFLIRNKAIVFQIGIFTEKKKRGFFSDP